MWPCLHAPETEMKAYHERGEKHIFKLFPAALGSPIAFNKNIVSIFITYLDIIVCIKTPLRSIASQWDKFERQMIT